VGRPVSASPLYQDVFIESLALELPPERVPSRVLEDQLALTYRRLGIPAGCFESLVGITARRFWPEGTSIDGAAATAARKAFTQAGREDLLPRTGLVVSTSVCKDYIEPSVAALVRGQLGLPETCDAFDLGNACLGFINGMDLAASWIEQRRVDVALVVAAESSRHVVQRTVQRLNEPTSTLQDYREALPTLTLGSGAVAMLLVHRDLARTTHRVRGAVTLGDAGAATICLGTPDWMKTDAPRLMQHGVALAAKTFRYAQERLGWTRQNLDHLLLHQVGAAHVATLCERLELDLARAFLTYPEYGNVGPVAVPMTLGLAVDAGQVKPGDRCALMGIGSGLSCAMLEVTW
jgi:3-oxoacyl-[acyl-carrier-protein] synthase III